MSKKRVEILAPAGSYESMTAAVNAGADAVYIGGSRFGARAYANNLDEETMRYASWKRRSKVMKFIISRKVAAHP